MAISLVINGPTNAIRSVTVSPIAAVLIGSAELRGADHISDACRIWGRESSGVFDFRGCGVGHDN